MKLITKDIASKLISAYEHSAETGEGGQEILVKFFTPWGNCTWFITEGMPVDDNGEPFNAERFLSVFQDADAYDWHLFGFCDLGDVINAELGYVMLSDLQSIKGPLGLRIERDRHYSGALADILAQYKQAHAA